MPLDEVLSALSLEAADCRGSLNDAEALAEVRFPARVSCNALAAENACVCVCVCSRSSQRRLQAA